ncbi:hypothetical protein DM860_006471 [Cuscuta australis]|uniref:Uncharacterized protein n=1 Tax=Cuscuta australis TaxID=267555 RepID=A0A328D7V1_9ASTE|nr:hypothetical protein DM860_006471 [Cuscuta australis]
MAFLFLPFIPAAGLGLAAAGAGAGAIGSLAGRQRTVFDPFPRHLNLPSFPDLLPRIHRPEMKREPVAVVASVPVKPNKPRSNSSSNSSDSESESDSDTESLSLPSLPSIGSSSESDDDDSDNETTEEKEKKKEKKRLKKTLKKMTMLSKIGEKMMSMKEMTNQSGGTKSVTVLAPPPEPSLYRTNQRAVLTSSSLRGGVRDRQAAAALYFSRN